MSGATQDSGLTVRDLRVRYRGGPEVVCGVDFEARPRQVLGLLGPNGAGKSSVLKAMVGLLPHTGTIALNDIDLSTLSGAERARNVAYVPQRTALSARLSVRSVVDLGRFAHRQPWARPTAEDRDIVERVLRDTDVAHLADRAFPTLSGGEQQRVLLARALATEASVLLLDEPTSALDVRQVLMLHTILRTLADRGATVVVVLHDLAEAHEYADRAVLMQAGHVEYAGPIHEVVAPKPARAVYDVELVERARFGYRLPRPGADR